jgi:ribonuclease-3
MDERLQDLGRALDYRFSRPMLLRDAVTHPSASSQRIGVSAFERLEFVGDRVLGLVVAEMLYRRFPDEAEGELARRQAALVSRDSLVRVALTLGIDRALVLSKEEGDGRTNPGMLADACEAVLGAVFDDGGFEPAARIVRARWEPLIAEAVDPPRDAKTALQEWAQGRGKPLPVYTVLSREGPAHDPVFHIAVNVSGELPAEGRGTSKRVAEQAAAAALLARVAP